MLQTELLLFSIAFGIIFIAIIFRMVKDTKKHVDEQRYNKEQPKIQEKVEVLKIGYKNARILRNRHLNLTPTYDITFKFTNGDQKKITVPKPITDYKSKRISEGDKGILTLQGTRFISFEDFKYLNRTGSFEVRIVDVEARPSNEEVSPSASNLLYNIVFEFSNGNRKGIIVPYKGNSNWICEGVKGILNLQSGHFIDFEKIE